MFRLMLTFICGIGAGALVYDVMLERVAVATMPQVECIWLSAPVKAGNDLKKCYVIGHQWGRQ